MKKIKTIRGYTALARFLANAEMTTEETTCPFKSPYAHSLTHPVYNHQGRKIIILETAHIKYDVYELPQFKPVDTLLN